MPRPSRGGRQSARTSAVTDSGDGPLIKAPAKAASLKENDRAAINDAYDPLEEKKAQIKRLIADIDKEGPSLCSCK